MKLCFVSPFPPRADGIAEFNQDLINNLKSQPQFSYFGVAVNVDDEQYEYKDVVKFQIRKNTLEDYAAAAEFINKSDCDLVCIQLEYSVFGGFDGIFLVDLIKRVKKKIVVVVHGLPINSYSRRKRTRELFFKTISPYVKAFITINPLQKKVLLKWGISNRVENIYHGAPDEILKYSHELMKRKLGLTDNIVVFNFGLFHKKKGLEYLIEAFSKFYAQNSAARLILIGETLVTGDPTFLTNLKIKLLPLVEKKALIFINQFLTKEEIYEYLAAADIFVTPYTKRDLVSSGPLSFATLANKFIITTPYPYAKSLLTDHEAFFVRYENADDIFEGFTYFQNNKESVKNMLMNLERKAETILWSKTAKEYWNLFQELK